MMVPSSSKGTMRWDGLSMSRREPSKVRTVCMVTELQSRVISERLEGNC